MSDNAIGGTLPASLSALTNLAYLCAAPPRPLAGCAPGFARPAGSRLALLGLVLCSRLALRPLAFRFRSACVRVGGCVCVCVRARVCV